MAISICRLRQGKFCRWALPPPVAPTVGQLQALATSRLPNQLHGPLSTHCAVWVRTVLWGCSLCCVGAPVHCVCVLLFIVCLCSCSLCVCAPVHCVCVLLFIVCVCSCSLCVCAPVHCVCVLLFLVCVCSFSFCVCVLLFIVCVFS